jgi:hypothetical protein
MASQKDKDYHMLRNSDKYTELRTANGDTYGNVNKLDAEAWARYRKLWSKYGFKSMVSDKRRRNTTRKSNQKDKQMFHQIERTRSKKDLRENIVSEDHQITTEPVKGKGYVILF